ncbi:MAG: hypothetical protein MJK12_15990 [Colwellia sp.]|nr:hypothetical protein [Colwellia sp.]
MNELSEEETSFKPEQLTIEEWDSHLQNSSERGRKNLKRAAQLAIRSKNRRKYSASGVNREELDRSYLHHDNYEVRKAKAEQLNGCQFKPAKSYKPYIWQNWRGPLPSKIKEFIPIGLGFCDGKTTTLQVNLSFWAMVTILQVVLFITAIVYLSDFQWFTGIVCGLLSIWGCNYLRKKLHPLDYFQFNRHTGLVKTPHSLLRCSFYIPYEDLACYSGTTIQGARSGGSVGTEKIRVTQIPKRYYLFTPSFILAKGGISDEHWVLIHEFMDTTKPLKSCVNEHIESYYIKDSNVAGDGPFPEEMKPYLDPDDKQVNRWHVW